MINEKITELISQHENDLIALRRYLHENPELSSEEYETTQLIVEKLNELGIPYKKTNPTGVIAEIKGGKPGKTVALRADMDALPVYELNRELEYRSKKDGIMHACGHDAHTAMLLTAVRALNDVKEELQGNIRLLFQPAEEQARGAKWLIDQGAMHGVDNVFGIHIWSNAPTGEVSSQVGPSFAAADIFKVTFKGKGGHGAMPQQANDATIMMAQYVNNIQAIVSRELDPLHPAVVTVGKMSSGIRFNVIAEDSFCEGTVRTFDSEARDTIEAKLEEYANAIAAMYHADYTFEYDRMTDAVNNEEKSAKLIESIAKEAFGEESFKNLVPTMGGEDFGFYLSNCPGAFATVGCANEEKDTCWAHHNGNFNIDEDALKVGAELYAQYAWAYLKEKE
ncbi:amidohydrolase [Facklamia sp. DSM 111018]|uniref:Amidohydrolase n=1 Tax=Facklamia lactis TaxID=2749967 RepID=A0ABS0LRV0_9LACT|nr:amidohydrolase [Facklamia lactis]MBG9980935.1 amidohydrolase [Facklamia lactis]MBG9986702.1 amidohydrolase [Facklamia lactis]